jgi:hypothetical protein
MMARGLGGGVIIGQWCWSCWGAVFSVFLLVVHPLFHPLPGLTHFLCLAKESQQKKSAPDAATHSLNFCRNEGKGKTRCAQTVSLPFSSLQQKFKAPSRARYGHTIDAPPQ